MYFLFVRGSCIVDVNVDKIIKNSFQEGAKSSVLEMVNDIKEEFKNILNKVNSNNCIENDLFLIHIISSSAAVSVHRVTHLACAASLLAAQCDL